MLSEMALCDGLFHTASGTALADIVTDGQMYFDDYVGGIGAFCWYMYERIPGFGQAKEPHPIEAGAAVRTKEIELFADWGGVINDGPVSRGGSRSSIAHPRRDAFVTLSGR